MLPQGGQRHPHGIEVPPYSAALQVHIVFLELCIRLLPITTISGTHSKDIPKVAQLFENINTPCEDVQNKASL